MSRFIRLALLFGLVAVGEFATATPASAQFIGAGGFRQQRFGFQSPFMPLFAPSYSFSNTRFQQAAFSIPGPSGNISWSVSRAYSYNTMWTGYGVNPFRTYVLPSYPTYGGYMTGGSVPNPAIDNAQANFEKAQREMMLLRNTPVKTQIYDQVAYEKNGTQSLTALKPSEQSEALQKALAATDESAIISGEALNPIMSAAVSLEEKKAKGVSAFLTPNLLNGVRFEGSPTADALNMIRSAGKLDRPVAFDSETLRPHAAAIEQDFAALAAPVLVGKPVDAAKLIKFETTLKAAHDAADPITRTLPFDEATALRRFLNRLDTTVKVLKDPNVVGFVNPAWSTEGTNVADLLKHMTKYKLAFGQAEAGDEDTYLALHRGLSAYLYSLSQSLKK